MTKRILIIGGYGNFGSYITEKLAMEFDLQVIIAGRSIEKCKTFINQLHNMANPVEYHGMDITKSFPLEAIRPDIVIHTSGPFQEQGYQIAQACIEHGCHYLDLADGREFVSGITKLNEKATAQGVTIISGASSVPCLSSAIIENYQSEFHILEELDYGITTAQQTNRGLATTSAILGYTGKPFQTLIDGKMKKVFGWQGLNMRKYPEFGFRALSNCDIPDLELFPNYYPDIKTIRFYAGTEIFFMHFGLWLVSWLVRWKLISSLKPAAKIFHKIARLCDWMGSSNSAFHMKMTGRGSGGLKKTKTITILAKEGHGPFIPCAPAIIIAKELARNETINVGAYPCVGLISLENYINELKGLNIRILES